MGAGLSWTTVLGRGRCNHIFVERRQTATLLVEVIKRVSGLEFIHPEFLLGNENDSANGGALDMDWHEALLSTGVSCFLPTRYQIVVGTRRVNESPVWCSFV